jgi:hypothetical protein
MEKSVIKGIKNLMVCTCGVVSLDNGGGGTYYIIRYHILPIFYTRNFLSYRKIANRKKMNLVTSISSPDFRLPLCDCTHHKNPD